MTSLRSIVILLVILPLLPCIAVAGDRPYSMPFHDLDDQLYRQVIVDHEQGQYLGHPTTVLLRENSRQHNSRIIFSDDEGKTWSKHRDLPASLNGDRHTGKYLSDGRLFISFRSVQPKGLTADHQGDWVAWVGTYDDLVRGNEGQYVVRLKDNKKGSDCAYPGVEVLPDDTIVTTTFGHWSANQMPYVLSVRLKLTELDAMSP